VEALMFQAGYLTIASHRSLLGRLELTLKYPNLEVQAALSENLQERNNLIDVEFSKTSRNIVGFEVETLLTK
jgi:hypothetical protein